MTPSSKPEGLPAPSGRYRVGRTSYDWVDARRAEIYSSDPQDHRELVGWVWYPAAPAPDAERAAYLPEPWAPTGHFLGLDATGLRSNAVADPAVATDQSTYPVLVMSPSGFPPLLLAAIGEELANHGYVVVGVNHTNETAVTVFADGRTIPMNPDAVAGGPRTTDRAPRGAVPAEGSGLRLQGRRPGFGCRSARAARRRHRWAMDVPLLPLPDESPAKAMLAATQIEPRRMWRITCDLLLAFFATHVRQEGIPSLLVGPSGDYPELSFGAP